MAARTVTSVRQATAEEARYHAGVDDAFVLILTSDLDDAIGSPVPLAFTRETLVQLVNVLCAFLGARMVRSASVNGDKA